ncbi:MAG: hypothetical protein QM636_22150 [Rhizobium sp.]
MAKRTVIPKFLMPVIDSPLVERNGPMKSRSPVSSRFGVRSRIRLVQPQSMSRKSAQRFCANDMRNIKELKREKRMRRIATRFREMAGPPMPLHEAGAYQATLAREGECTGLC